MSGTETTQSLAGEGSTAQWLERYTDVMLPVFARPQTVLVRGAGCEVWDADGKRYLDLLGGIAVNVLGHAHPALVAAVSEQMATLDHVSNYFATPTQIALAERLLALVGAPAGGKVYFANSGTEANEAAFKIARRNNPDGRRTRILALENSFHGRTLGALALTYKAKYREPFEPLPGGVEFIPAGDIAALEQAFADGRGEQVAALFAEPIQGEAGVLPLPSGYLARARELTAEHGALLILDEVQSGMGRTGHWFAHHDPAIGGAIVPDVVTMAKGLGGGFPIGATIALGPLAPTLLAAGQHGTTFGGNPVAAAAGLATLDVIERDQLLANASIVGSHLMARARQMAETTDALVTGARGAGLLIGITLKAPVADQVAHLALAAGFIVNAVAPDTIRLAPPLIVTIEQADTFADFLAGLRLVDGSVTFAAAAEQEL